MRLFADRAIRHRARLKPFNYLFNRFNYLKWNWLSIKLQLHEAAQRRHSFGLIINQLAVFFERSVIIAATRLLQQVDRTRIKEMQLAVFTVLILSIDVERMPVERNFWKGSGVL